MALFRRRHESAAEALPHLARGDDIDLVRFDLLLRTSQMLHDAGVDYESIQERASADSLSFNEALEAMYAERSRG
jgi:hypothetical protein